MSETELTGRITGIETNLERLVLFPRRVMAELAPTVRKLGADMQSGASARAPYRLGRLARTMKLKVTESAEEISAQVFPGTRYGFILAAGTNKTFYVAPHTRRIPQGSAGAYVPTKELKTRTRIKFKQTSQGIEFVKGYTRRVKMEPRRFLGDTYDALKGEIVSEIDSAIARGKAVF